MSHDQLLAQEQIHRAYVLICRERGLDAEDSVRALAEHAASAAVSLHVAAMEVLGRSVVGATARADRDGFGALWE